MTFFDKNSYLSVIHRFVLPTLEGSYFCRFFCFLKHVFFRHRVFYLDGSSIFTNSGLLFSAFLVFFFRDCLGVPFLAIPGKYRAWSANYSTFGAFGVLLQHKASWILGEKQEHRSTLNLTSFVWHFLEIVSTPTQEPRFCRAPKQIKMSILICFCVLFSLSFCCLFDDLFWQKLIS